MLETSTITKKKNKIRNRKKNATQNISAKYGLYL